MHYVETRLEHIPLPAGFVCIMSGEPFCIVYAGMATIRAHLVSGELKAEFYDNFDSVVVNFTNERRFSTSKPADPVMFDRDHPAVQSAGGRISVLAVVIKELLKSNGITDGHTARLYNGADPTGEPLAIIEKI